MHGGVSGGARASSVVGFLSCLSLPMYDQGPERACVGTFAVVLQARQKRRVILQTLSVGIGHGVCYQRRPAESGLVRLGWQMQGWGGCVYIAVR